MQQKSPGYEKTEPSRQSTLKIRYTHFRIPSNIPAVNTQI